MTPKPHVPVFLSFRSKPKSLQMTVLKEPKRIPVDPPFGPLFPLEEWDGLGSDVVTEIQPFLLEGDEKGFYPIPNNNDDDVRKALEVVMSKWYARAERDLLDITGSRQGPARRGEEQKTILVNVINTFKTGGSEAGLVSKAIGWVSQRLRCISKAVEAWTVQRAYPCCVRCRRALRELLDGTMRNGRVRSPFRRLKIPEAGAIWDRRIKSVVDQIDSFYRITGFRSPDSKLSKALQARCDMFAALASVAAKQCEADEESASRQAWVAWATKAGEASASAAHKFTKAAMGLGADDLTGSKLSKAESIDAEVDKWSKLWKEGQSLGKPAFGRVPCLPPLDVSKVRKASLSFKRATCSLSGFHPRHVALLPNSAI